MDALDDPVVETDQKFPSGPWTGFFLQCWLPGRHSMELDLTFEHGQLTATGNDAVGNFTFEGEYDLADGKCHWVKQYLGRHQVTYSGVNQGQGIWGVWQLRQLGGLYKDQGVYHIWPRGMTPAKEAEATVEAYLSHLRSHWPFHLMRILIPSAILLALVLLIFHLAQVWIGGLLP